MDTNIENEIAYAGSFRRSMASMIDVFIVAFLRVIAAQFLGMIWLQGVLINLASDYSLYFGTDVIRTDENLLYIVNHDGFKDIIAFFVIIFLIGAFYHAYLNSSSWKATIGKRLFGIIILNRKYDKIGILRGFCHYFLSLLPVVIILYLVGYQVANGINIVQAVSSNIFNIFLAFCAVMWVNIHVFSNKKTTAYDLICRTLLLEGKSIAKTPWQKIDKDEI